jgi:hypothetical protein
MKGMKDGNWMDRIEMIGELEVELFLLAYLHLDPICPVPNLALVGLQSTSP